MMVLIFMKMKKIQVQFEEEDYQNIKKIGFLESRAISDIIRQATKIYISQKKYLDKDLEKNFASDEEVDKAINESIEDFSEVYAKLAK